MVVQGALVGVGRTPTWEVGGGGMGRPRHHNTPKEEFLWKENDLKIGVPGNTRRPGWLGFVGPPTHQDGGFDPHPPEPYSPAIYFRVPVQPWEQEEGKVWKSLRHQGNEVIASPAGWGRGKEKKKKTWKQTILF